MKRKALSLQERIRERADSLAKQLETARKDPAFLEAVYLRQACPNGVSPERYGVAIRRAHDMLHAHPSSINSQSCVDDIKPKTPVMPACKVVIIIPQGDKLREAVGSSPMKWTIHQLRYSKGCLAIKDDGTETETFPNVARLLSTIKQYGFKVEVI